MGKMNSFQSSIACIILKAFAAFLQALPPGPALWIGRRMGELTYWLNPKNRRKAYQNLRTAFGEQHSPEMIDRILWDSYRAFGQNAIEVGRLQLVARQGGDRYVTVEGREHVAAAMQQGKGLIFLSLHSGNWELSNLVGSMAGYPYNMVANYLANVNKVADLLDSWRMSAGCRIINPGIGGREIIRALKRNEIVTLVVDQGGEEGMLAPFFGRLTSMSTGAIRIALKYDVPICLVDIHRVAGQRHHLMAEPFHLTRTGDPEADLKMNMDRVTRRFEQIIRQHPQEYLWFYKTWKYATDRKVVILDDGRTGHLRQSQAVARLLGTELHHKGLQAVIETIPVSFSHPGAPFLLKVFSWCCPFMAVLGIRALRPFLTAETFALMASIKPDIVVSCGSRTSWVTRWFARDNDARTVHILRPGGPSFKSFDLVVLPRHDLKGATPANAVTTRIALNLIDKFYIDENVRGLLTRFSHLKLHSRMKIGLLIGGDTKGLVLGERQMKVVIHQLKEVAERFSADILVTTSRRTNADVERLVLRELKGADHCALAIIASKNNVPEAVGGILGLSDVVVVSGESISMVSEAVASGKKVVVFPVEGEDRLPLNNKYNLFTESLSGEGFLMTARSSGIAEALDALLKNKIRLNAIDDNVRIAEALRKISL